MLTEASRVGLVQALDLGLPSMDAVTTPDWERLYSLCLKECYHSWSPLDISFPKSMMFTNLDHWDYLIGLA